MSDLVLAEIKGTDSPLLFSIPFNYDINVTWEMINKLCRKGEVVSLTVSNDLFGTKETELCWPVSPPCLRRAISTDHFIHELKPKEITSYHSVLGEFFIAHCINRSIKERKLIKVIRQRHSFICIKLSLLGRSISLGWRN